jgi:hypothetical protein
MIGPNKTGLHAKSRFLALLGTKTSSVRRSRGISTNPPAMIRRFGTEQKKVSLELKQKNKAQGGEFEV